MPQTLSVKDEHELADIVRAAGADRRRLEIVGRGTKRGLGRPIEADAVLDLSAHSGILRYEPDELIITARAATPIAEIESVVAAKHQRLGFDPADWGPLFGAPAGRATIGGALSADASGSARLRYGAARDHLLGYRAVNGWGEIYRAGGQVVKNVTGFDLPKLLCGAMGTLGVLSEVTLRLVPRALQSAVVLAKDVDAETGLSLLRRIWSSPLEPTGLAYLPGEMARVFPELGNIGAGASLFRVDGAAAPLADKIASLNDLLDARDTMLLAESDDVFARIGSGQALTASVGDVWRVFVPPSAAVACVRMLDVRLWLADWAGGVLWIADDENKDVHAMAARCDGYAVLMRAPAEKRRATAIFAPEAPARAALTRRVKDAFDPLRLFNPGRMFDGI